MLARRLAVAVLALCLFTPGQAQAPPPAYFVKLSPTVFGIQLPAANGNPESHCYVWVKLGGFYDAEVACYTAGKFTGWLAATAAGQSFDGGFKPKGGGFIRWAFEPCTAASPCVAAPAGLTNPTHFQMAGDLGDGSPPQVHDGYY